VYGLLLLLPNVRNDRYYGLIEVEVEFNGSDVGVSTANARRSVGRLGSVDESVAVAVRRRRPWGQVRLAQVVYEERNRGSGRRYRMRITITFATTVRRAQTSRAKRGQVSRTDSHYYHSTTQSKAGK
jgi:hypothetical protein